MVTDLFSAILQELGTALRITRPLQPDQNNTCQIKFKENIRVQIEIDRTGNYLVLGTDLGAIPLGQYRENLFAQALKANGLPGLRHGIFAYSKQSDHLVLFEMFNLRDLSGVKVASFLPDFVQKALLWKTAIETGDIPPIAMSSAPSKPSGIFGLAH